EGSLLFDEAEKAHPRVLDILLQLLDAARLTVATGQTLEFGGFYVWLTSNIGSAELMSLQHSNCHFAGENQPPICGSKPPTPRIGDVFITSWSLDSRSERPVTS